MKIHSEFRVCKIIGFTYLSEPRFLGNGFLGLIFDKTRSEGRFLGLMVGWLLSCKERELSSESEVKHGT